MRGLHLMRALAALALLGPASCRDKDRAVADSPPVAPVSSASAASSVASAAPSASAAPKRRRVAADCKAEKFATKNEKLKKAVGVWSGERGELTLTPAGGGLMGKFSDGDADIRWTVTSARLDGDKLDVLIQSSLPNGLRLSMKLTTSEPDVFEGTTTAMLAREPNTGRDVEPASVSDRYERNCP